MVDFIAHLVYYNVIGYETLRKCLVNETFTYYQHQWYGVAYLNTLPMFPNLEPLFQPYDNLPKMFHEIQFKALGLAPPPSLAPKRKELKKCLYNIL